MKGEALLKSKYLAIILRNRNYIGPFLSLIVRSPTSHQFEKRSNKKFKKRSNIIIKKQVKVMAK